MPYENTARIFRNSKRYPHHGAISPTILSHEYSACRQHSKSPNTRGRLCRGRIHGKPLVPGSHTPRWALPRPFMSSQLPGGRLNRARLHGVVPSGVTYTAAAALHDSETSSTPDWVVRSVTDVVALKVRHKLHRIGERGSAHGAYVVPPLLLWPRLPPSTAMRLLTMLNQLLHVAKPQTARWAHLPSPAPCSYRVVVAVRRPGHPLLLRVLPRLLCLLHTCGHSCGLPRGLPTHTAVT